MAMLDEWTAAAARELELDPADAADAAAYRDLVLELAREAAHQVTRPAAPLTTYLLGVAVGRGASPEGAAARLTALARDWPAEPAEPGGPAPDPPAPAG